VAIVRSAAGARFSSCRRWRTLLWRRWSDAPAANFVMLNPSTADEIQLDPTCARARGYAEAWGYGALIVTNIFSWRATDPARLKATDDPVGRGNDRAILAAAREAKLVVCAWGNHAALQDRGAEVAAMLRKAGTRLHALRITAAGAPSHPLYLPGALKPVPWE
jgi:hypothetical protein